MTSKFVLVHSARGIEDAKARVASSRTPPLSFKRVASEIGDAISASATVLRASKIMDLLSSQLSYSIGAPALPPKARTRSVRRLKQAPRLTVGVWSLNAWLGPLSGMIEALNDRQSAFVFFEVDALVPAGLISRPERMVAWLKAASVKEPDENARREVKDNLIANDYFGLAEDLRSDLGLDYIVGITPSMVAGTEDDGRVYYNYFSTFEGRNILASTNQLRQYAELSGQKFEAFLAHIIISQLLVAVFWPTLYYHADSGCLFDENRRRAALIDKVSEPRIDEACMERIKPQYRDAAQALLDFLKSYRSIKP